MTEEEGGAALATLAIGQHNDRDRPLEDLIRKR
jgi:hypothetical protein